jgi:sigma-B regulation protein RsbU (phosphoserine phosphatase)
MSAASRRATGRRLLLAMAPLLLILEIPGAIEFWRRPFVGVVLRNQTVMVVEPGSAAERAGIRPGDVVVALADRPTATYAAYVAALSQLRIGQSTHLEIERSGERHRVEVELAAKPVHRRARDMLLSAVALCFLFLGFVTYLKRNDALGRYFHGSCLLFAYQFLDLPTFPWPTAMLLLEQLRDVLQLLLPAVFLRFCLIFPEGRPQQDPARRRQRWLFVPPLTLAAVDVALDLTGHNRTPLALAVLTMIAVVFGAYVLAAVVVFARKSRRQDRWVYWSKLRLAVLGLAAGLLPLVLATVARQIWPAHTLPLDQASVLFLPLVPASFSLALLRTGAIDLAYLTRQGLIALALSLPAVMVGAVLFFGVVPALEGGNRGLGYLAAVTGVVLAAVAASPTRRHVGAVVDRFFYPEQVALRAAASELGGRLSRLRDAAQIAETLVSRVLDLFQCRAAFLYRVEHDAVALLVRAGEALPIRPPERFERQGGLVGIALDSGDLVLVEPLLTGARSRRLDPKSRHLIASTEAVLLCPLIAGGEPVALLILGPRADGSAYSSLHLYHVQLLARQAAASLENALLHQDDLARERLRTELDLARDIQSKLLPAAGLSVGEFHICGRMLSSSEVGGDLFDYFQLGDGRVVITVADASGKGVPASLLMSSVRTAVRETMRPGRSAIEAIGHLNRDVHAMTSEHHFVALFLGILDPRNGVLEYTVAGIEPPLWYRSGPNRLEVLNRGGPVLGVSPTLGYKSGVIRMAPGDAILAYSDGMIDQEDPDGGEFGIARLAQVFREVARHESPDILEEVTGELARFGGDEPTDDRTLLVVKFHQEAPLGMEHARTG